MVPSVQVAQKLLQEQLLLVRLSHVRRSWWSVLLLVEDGTADLVLSSSELQDKFLILFLAFHLLPSIWTFDIQKSLRSFTLDLRNQSRTGSVGTGPG